MKIISHNWIKIKSLPWPICSGCGLLKLRNKLTDMAVSCGCDHEDHPRYQKLLRKIKGK